MPKKTTKKDYIPHIDVEKAPKCDIGGCRESGAYKAPKSKNLDEYQWLCLEHIREYNKKWDYFQGMDRDQIEAFMRDAVTGHRPTWNRETRLRDPRNLQDALYEFLHGVKRPAKTRIHIPTKVRKALAVLDMDYPYTQKELKMQYRLLVKKHHPDVNKNNKLAEEKFKAITTSYHFLMAHIKSV
jgi:hypothetical protein